MTNGPGTPVVVPERRARLSRPRPPTPAEVPSGARAEGRPRPQAAFLLAAFLALVAYMSTYSWPESFMTWLITSSVTARST